MVHAYIARGKKKPHSYKGFEGRQVAYHYQQTHPHDHQSLSILF
jgi:hypothetical protein